MLNAVDEAIQVELLDTNQGASGSVEPLQHQQDHTHSKPAHRGHSSLLLHLQPKSWAAGLGSRLRRLSVPPLLVASSKRRQKPPAADSPPQLRHQPPTAPRVRLQPAAPMSNAERHRINLLFHLLRDHTDALRLRLGELGQLELLGDDDDDSLLLAWLDLEPDDFDNDDFQDSDNEVLLSASEGDDGHCCDYFKNKKCDCDSDSCRSGHSGDFMRFKHQRRSVRWNQEYDREFRETVGLLDQNCVRVYQIK